MSDENTLSPAQCLGARGMLGISRADLAARAKISQATLADYETGKRRPYARTVKDIRHALESAGIEFIPENGGGAGVRLKKGM